MRQKKYPILFFILLFFCLISSLSFADASKAKDAKAKDIESVSKFSDTKLTKNSGSTNVLSLNSIDWWGSPYVFVLRPGLLESLLPVAPKRPPPKMPPLPTDPRELCEYYFRNGTNFESKVSNCPQLGLQINWQQPNGNRVTFNEWTRAQKDRINELYDRIQRNVADLGVACPNPQDGVNVEVNRLYISANEAFDMYAAYIAQSIYLEANRLVPWSLLDNVVAENQSILDSSQYFSIITPTDEGLVSVVRNNFRPGTAYQSPSWNYATRSLLNCDPRIPYLFLNGTYSSTRTNLLGDNQSNTIKNISWWFHENVYHGRGFSTIFSDWLRSQVFLRDRLAQRTVTSVGGTTTGGVDAAVGCHSAANLFLELARGINIPIRIFWYLDQPPPVGEEFSMSGVHMGIAYRWSQTDARIVVHADDLYVQNKSIFPITSDAHVMGASDIKSTFFNSVWMSIADAERWGTHYYRTLPLILPGQDINQTLPARINSRPDYGYFGGYNQVRRLSDNNYTVGASATNLERNYQMCGWSNFLDTYCEDTASDHLNFYGLIYGIINYNFINLSFPLPVSRTLDDYMNRASACVRINGGCDALVDRLDVETRGHGSNFLRMP